jgi:GTP cyclohydrolase II
VLGAGTRLDREALSPSEEEAAALELLKLAHLLPAAITAELPRGLDPTAIPQVTVPSITDFRNHVANRLKIVARTRVPLADCERTEFVLFHGSDGLKEQVAIVVGSPDLQGVVPVRLHSACLTGDLFGSLKCDCGDQLRRAVREIANMGGGVLLYLDQEGRSIGLRNKLRAYRLQERNHDTLDADAILGYGPDERQYQIAARMLTMLGCERVLVLTNNPNKIRALADQGVEVAGSKRLFGRPNKHNRGYLETKARRAGHALSDLVAVDADARGPVLVP